jgi:hypothetical protein
VQCPSINVSYKLNDRNKMRNHFAQCHIGDKIQIQEEGLLPQCNRCGFQSSTFLTPAHLASKKCAELSKRCLNLCRLRKQLVAKNFIPIIKVRQFKYLGSIVDDSDKDDSAIDRNIQRARGVWARLGKLLSQEGANPIAMRIFYKVIVQSVLLYGSESWVITKSKMVQLRSFHRRCARYITRTHIRQEEDGTWIHPSSEGILKEAGLDSIEEYIQKRRGTVEVFAQFRPLYEACKNSTPLRSRNHAVWWNQVHFSQNDENENVHD